MKKRVLILLFSIFATLSSSAFTKAFLYTDRSYFLKGGVGEYPATMVLVINPTDSLLSGYYYYDRVGIRMPLRGTIKGSRIEMTEENTNGVNSGHFEGSIDNDGNIEGQWYSAQNKKLDFSFGTPEICTNKFRESYFMKGSLSKYPISITLSLNSENDSIQGYYKYDRVGKKITLKGACSKQGFVELKEYVNNLNTGTFQGQLSDGYSLHGSWHSLQGNKTLEFSVKTANPKAMAVVINSFEVSDGEYNPDEDNYEFDEKDFALEIVDANKKITYENGQNSSLFNLADDYQSWQKEKKEKEDNSETNETDDDQSNTPYTDTPCYNNQTECTFHHLDATILSYHIHQYIDNVPTGGPGIGDAGYVVSLNSMKAISAENMFNDVSDQKLCTIEQQALYDQGDYEDKKEVFEKGLKAGFENFLSRAEWWITDNGIDCHYTDNPYEGGWLRGGFDVSYTKKEILPYVKPKFSYLFK